MTSGIQSGPVWAEHGCVESSSSPKPRRETATEAVDSLRLPAVALAKLHEIMDAAESVKKATSTQRHWRRWVMRNRLAEATIHHPGGTAVRCVISPRTMSAGGMSIIHGGFVYTGVKIIVHLERLTHEVEHLEGKVVRCRHLGKHLHELGVQFDKHTEPRAFISLGDTEESFLLERVDPKTVQGRVLVVEDSRADQRLIAHLLKDTEVQAEFVDDPVLAVTTAVQGFDLILLDYHLKDANGAELLEKMREAQVMTPAVMVTADDSPATARRSRDAGASAMIYKPITAESLLRALGEFLVLRGGLAVGAGAIISTSQADEAMKELLESFVNDLDKMADDIAEALRNNDLETIKRLCSEIKGSGASYGFPVLTQAATITIRAIERAGPGSDTAGEVRRLLEVCRRCST